MDGYCLIGASAAILYTKMSSSQLRVGLERDVEGRSLAWALDFPGAFAYGKNNAEALEKLPDSLLEYERWIGQHSDGNWVSLAEFEQQVVESFDIYLNNENGTVNAFFEDDRRPMEAKEIDKALKLHTWQRQDLLTEVENLSPQLMTRMLPGQRWNINGVLNHIARTEIQYLGSLKLPLPKGEFLVHNPFKLLELSYEMVQKALPGLEGNARIVDNDGELWSARKLLRRLLWHQRNHIEHIRQIVEMVNE